MKKFITTSIMFILAAVLVVSGVMAAQTQQFSVISKVSFTVTDVFVSVYGEVTGVAGTTGGTLAYGSQENPEKNYTDANAQPVALNNWTIGNITINEQSAMSLELVIKNDGPLTIAMKVVHPDLDSALLELTGSYQIDSESAASIDFTDDLEVEIDQNQIITLVYNVAIADYHATISEVDFSFTVGMKPATTPEP